MTESSAQLALGVSLDDDATFANFLVSQGNEQAVVQLQAPSQDPSQAEQFLYLWGTAGSGLTHLLQAACHHASEQGLGAIYVPLSECVELGPDILHGTNSLSLVCLDSLDSIAGMKEWESELFTLFNALREAGSRLVITNHCSPQQTAIELPDLVSRLQSGLALQVLELSDSEKRRSLQLRAANRGMELADASADYILQRANRNLAELMQILDVLDENSLRQQRKLTVPFIKQVLGW